MNLKKHVTLMKVACTQLCQSRTSHCCKMVSRTIQMSECVVSELLNASERKEREAFSSDDSIVDGNWKSVVMNLRARNNNY